MKRGIFELPKEVANNAETFDKISEVLELKDVRLINEKENTIVDSESPLFDEINHGEEVPKYNITLRRKLEDVEKDGVKLIKAGELQPEVERL